MLRFGDGAVTLEVQHQTVEVDQLDPAGGNQTLSREALEV
jgi:hypothetical protein